MKTEHADCLFTLPALLTPAQCRVLIDHAEEVGFVRAAVRSVGGPVMLPGVRNNDRAEFDDPELAATLWRLCQPFVHTLEDGTALGLDEHFRYYRYEAGQRFKRHRDGVVTRSATVRSRLSCLFYLNDGFTGGETVFYADDGTRTAVVVPGVGDALLFRHEWWHEGCEVLAGRKYVLRSDVFYEFI